MGVQRGLETHVLDRTTEGIKPEMVAALGARYHHGDITDVSKECDPDVVIECTGVAELVAGAMRHTAPGAIVCLTGVAWSRNLSVDVGVLNNELGAENDVVFGSVNANRRHFEQAVESLRAPPTGTGSGGSSRARCRSRAGRTRSRRATTTSRSSSSFPSASGRAPATLVPDADLSRDRRSGLSGLASVRLPLVARSPRDLCGQPRERLAREHRAPQERRGLPLRDVRHHRPLRGRRAGGLRLPHGLAGQPDRLRAAAAER